jgi:hypothetical protein
MVSPARLLPMASRKRRTSSRHRIGMLGYLPLGRVWLTCLFSGCISTYVLFYICWVITGTFSAYVFAELNTPESLSTSCIMMAWFRRSVVEGEGWIPDGMCVAYFC